MNVEAANGITAIGEAWKAMVEASRHPDGGLWLDAPAIAKGVGCDVDSVGLVACITSYRGADVVIVSNQRVALAELRRIDPDAKHHFTDRWPHPFVGWIEHTFIDLTVPTVAEYAARITQELDEYPLLDEYDYSELEYAMAHPDGDTRCYVEGYDCDCGRERA